MRKPNRWLAVWAVVWVAGLCVLVGVRPGSAADKKDTKDSPMAAEARETVVKMAGSVDKKDMDEMKKQATTLAKKLAEADEGYQGLEPVMNLLKLRKMGGLGVGPKEGVYDPDGIEAKVIALAKLKLKPADITKQADDIAQLAQVLTVVAQIADERKPTKKMGDKDPKDWQKWTNEMRDSSIDLAAAIKKANPDPKEINDISKKLNASCSDCHAKFKPSKP
jgi:hypothetical protein